MLKVSLISDTHTKHSLCGNDLPGGDLLIHAGDFMNSGYSEREAFEFLEWIDKQRYDKKVFIAGNHDRLFEIDKVKKYELLKQFPNLIYLEDELFGLYNLDTDKSVKIYGSPWQPEFYNWAFNLPRNDKEMKARWDAIPANTDILVTHGPPFGYQDIPGGVSIRVGCEMLRYRVDEIKPKIHVFGHIHGSAGYYFDGHTHFFNASILNEQYQYTNLPFTFEWDNITNEIKWL